MLLDWQEEALRCRVNQAVRDTGGFYRQHISDKTLSSLLMWRLRDREDAWDSGKCAGEMVLSGCGDSAYGAAIPIFGDVLEGPVHVAGSGHKAAQRFSDAVTEGWKDSPANRKRLEREASYPEGTIVVALADGSQTTWERCRGGWSPRDIGDHFQNDNPLWFSEDAPPSVLVALPGLFCGKTGLVAARGCVIAGNAEEEPDDTRIDYAFLPGLVWYEGQYWFAYGDVLRDQAVSLRTLRDTGDGVMAPAQKCRLVFGDELISQMPSIMYFLRRGSA